MRQVRYDEVGGPEVLKIVEVDLPAPGADEVRVRGEAMGIGRWDMLMRAGRYPLPTPLPGSLGLDMAGYVEAVGSDISDLKVGDRVYVAKSDRDSYRCYADQVDAKRGEVTLLDDGVDFESAICLGSYRAAWSLLYDAAEIRRVKTAAMFGAAGAVGVALAQLCRNEGIAFIAITSSRQKADFAIENGAAFAIATDEENMAERLLELTGGWGVDLLFDQVVGPNFRDNIKLMAPLGQIVTINALGGTPSSDLFVDLRANMLKSISVRAFSAHVYEAFPERRAKLVAEIMKLFVAGKLEPCVNARFPLADVVRAHQALDAGKTLGKMILTP